LRLPELKIEYHILCAIRRNFAGLWIEDTNINASQSKASPALWGFV